MIKNYLKIAFRNLWNNKGFSAINITGLAVGLATCLLMLFYVTDEMSYDKYNEKAGRNYRVDGDIQFVSAVLLAILIALFNISFQAVKAAIANPVKSLRTE